jgi:uncharacterized protein DUF6885
MRVLNVRLRVEMEAPRLELELLPGARALLAAREAAIPQRDDLCGALCGALALRAAGIERRGEELVDQDLVAVAAGSVVSAVPDERHLPAGARSRRDYRLELPLIEDAERSGTTAAGLARALEELSGGALAALPLTGPWSAGALDGLFEAAASSEGPVTFVANLATRHLWGAGAGLAALLDYLLDGTQEGPPADWDVGHFVCVFARARGPAGTLYAIADTYPQLGRGGLHLQPAERLALALRRPGMAPGGLLVAAAAGEAARLRARAAELGLREGAWDNGTVAAETAA